MNNATANTTTVTSLEKRLTLAEARAFFKNEHVYEGRAGEYLVNFFGKYLPNMTFIISSVFEMDENERVKDPLTYVSDAEMAAEMNMRFDGNTVGFVFGDFWRSRKGGACFRPKDPMESRHILVEVNWGGCFSRTGGNYAGDDIPGVIYFRRARSNGGGLGNDYYVVPIGYHLVRDAEGRPQEGSVRNAEKFRKKHAELRREAREKQLRAYDERVAAEAAAREARETFLPRLKEIQAELEGLHQPQPSGVRYGVGEIKFLDKAFFKIGYNKYLFGEEGLAEAEAYLVQTRQWVSGEEAKRKAEADARSAFTPEFESLRPKVEGFGWKITLDEDSVRVENPAKPVGWRYNNPQSYSYSREGVDEFKMALAAEDDRQAEEARKARQAELEAQGRSEGLPSDVRIWHRAGATNAGAGWVIRSDGTDRECDMVDTSMLGSNTKRYHQSYEGDHIWRQICPGELVLTWRKAYTAAEHEFSVIYAPTEPTEAQLERVAEIQEEIEASWKGRTGLASRRVSPPIGQGWGLLN